MRIKSPAKSMIDLFPRRTVIKTPLLEVQSWIIAAALLTGQFQTDEQMAGPGVSTKSCVLKTAADAFEALLGGDARSSR